MVYSIAKEICFIPEWNNNKEQPKNDQIKVYIQLPSAAELADSYSIENNDSAIMNQFLLYVKRVENFKIDTGLMKRKATPKDIVETSGLSDLWAEIKNFYTEYVSIDKKK